MALFIYLNINLQIIELKKKKKKKKRNSWFIIFRLNSIWLEKHNCNTNRHCTIENPVLN